MLLPKRTEAARGTSCAPFPLMTVRMRHARQCSMLDARSTQIDQSRSIAPCGNFVGQSWVRSSRLATLVRSPVPHHSCPSAIATTAACLPTVSHQITDELFDPTRLCPPLTAAPYRLPSIPLISSFPPDDSFHRISMSKGQTELLVQSTRGPCSI